MLNNLNIKINNENYNIISNNILSHYKCINNVRKMCDNIFEVLKGENFKFNVAHTVSYNKNHSKNFLFVSDYDIIAFSDKKVIFFVVRPSFDNINKNNVIMDILFHNFILYNINDDTNNYKRYHGKEIIPCVLTFNNDKPIFIENISEEYNNHLKSVIKNSLTIIYNKYHEIIRKICKIINYDEYKINKIYEKIENIKKIPDYILTVFKDADECKENLSKLEIKFDKWVNKYLELDI